MKVAKITKKVLKVVGKRLKVYNIQFTNHYKLSGNKPIIRIAITVFYVNNLNKKTNFSAYIYSDHGLFTIPYLLQQVDEEVLYILEAQNKNAKSS